MHSLKNENLLDGLGADPATGPSLKALRAGPSNHMDLLMEDTSMRRSGVEDAKAQEILSYTRH